MAWTISIPTCKLQQATMASNVMCLRRRPTSFLDLIILPRRRSPRLLLALSSSGDGGAVDANSQRNIEASKETPVNAGDSYVGLFVRMLGIDNDPLDREQAVVALWKYSQGGKNCIDVIMQFHGCVNLIVNLLKSDSSYACEAATGLLRTISTVNSYRHLVAESGAIEEIIGLLRRPSLSAEVKEQSICTLWNLSVDEKRRSKIADSDLLPALIKFLDDEEIKVKEAAGGVLANLALNDSNHNMMVEAGVIQKLARLVCSREGSEVTRKEAKNVLLELAKDEYYRILIIEEGLVLVPIVGAAAYKSLKPVYHSWPSLPDGTEIERNSRSSRYGASDLLLGLNIRDKNLDLEETKMKAIVGRTQQQFLARIGAIEMEEGRKPLFESSPNQQYTLLSWMDGIARLVLILELEDASAVTRAAQSIADASIKEHMRTSFKEAGAIKHLVRLLGHHDEPVRLSVAHALEKLSVSSGVCRVMEAEGVVDPLVNILKQNTSEGLIEKIVNILARILDPGKEMKTTFNDGPVNGSKMLLNGTSRNSAGGTGLPITLKDISVQNAMTWDTVFDSGAISCLIEILKTASANLQRKTASVLEYLAATANIETFITSGIESGLDAVFRQRFVGISDDIDEKTEVSAIEAEEGGLAISAASRLLAKLLCFEQFQRAINSTHFSLLLRGLLKSDIPLHAKEWVAASLVKLEFLTSSHVDPENPIELEVTLYETIPRLVQQIKTSFSIEAQEAAVVELNEIISKGIVDCSRAVAAQGGIPPLVKVIEEGSGNAVEAGLAILYNLSMDSENHSEIIAAGAVPVLRRIVLSEGPQWMRALHLLRTLPT